MIKREAFSNNDAASSMPVQNTNKDDNIENDNIFVDGCSRSVGSIIKSAAINIHDDLVKGKPLSSRDIKIMSNGLSSILDLNDSSVNSQMSLFENPSLWEQLKVKFLNKHFLEMTTLPSVSSSLWKIIINTMKKSGDLEKGLKYIHKAYYEFKEEDRKSLDIYEHLIKCIKYYPEYLSKTPEFEIRENDYIRILWSPLLEALFVKDKSIRIICSESCNPSTAAKKKTIYSEAKNVIAFKIDVRIVCCYNGVNYELVNGEAACHSGDDKIVQDEGKLTREGKDIQNCFVENQCSTLFPFMLQLVGPLSILVRYILLHLVFILVFLDIMLLCQQVFLNLRK
ncbi:unnamed protein product [Rhizopus stolonifer]